MRKIFVTGIGTGIGKTLVSAILTQALKADYWKPVQCGEIENTDSMKVRALLTNTGSFIHPESYRFKAFMSPHAAARMENIEIDMKNIHIPDTKNNNMVIEGAGGLMVPLNENHLVIDLINYLEAEAILVVQNYLGSINHTLLSAEALARRKIKTTGVIFNGEPVNSSEEIILKYTGLKCLGRISREPVLDKAVINKYSRQFINL